MLWDIFCRVIDNYGDIGVCWRLTAELAQRGERVRLWVDDSSALKWMAPGSLDDSWPSITVLPWQQASNNGVLQGLEAADVWVEAFGCDISFEFIGHFVSRSSDSLSSSSKPVWINLEYLTAEAYAQRVHALPSPVQQGPAKGRTKFFFYPGFCSSTGGLLREQDLADRQQQCRATPPVAWLNARGIHFGDASDSAESAAAPLMERFISLFCYETPTLAALLQLLAHDQAHCTRVLVAAGRSTDAVRAVAGARLHIHNLHLHYLPPLTQREFDELLWLADINFVRGEDSLVRALWAAKPFVWHIYPQEDGAHVAKLHAFLDRIEASAELRTVHAHWNAVSPDTTDASAFMLPAITLWQRFARDLRSRLIRMPELTTALIQFAHKNR